MALSDFPMAEILTHGDLYVFIKGDESLPIIVPALDLLQWYEHGCNCIGCENAQTIMDKHLIHGTNRVELPSGIGNVVYFDVQPDMFDLTKLDIIQSVLDQQPICLYNKEKQSGQVNNQTERRNKRRNNNHPRKWRKS